MLAPRYAEFIGREIQKAYIESYSEYGQNLFDRYIAYADAWIEDQDYKDPDTGQVFDRQMLDAELSKIEKPAGIANPKDFRNEMVKFALRARAANGGRNPSWTSYEKIREVIEKRMFSQVEDLLPVISFGAKQDTKTEKQHADFLDRMKVARLHGAAGAPAGGMVHARQQGRVRRGGPRHGPIRRPPPQSARQEPGQPAALPRAGPRRGQAARSTRRCASARSPTSSKGGSRLDPDRRHRRAAASTGLATAATANCVLPGNKEFVAGDSIDKPQGRRRGRRAAGQGAGTASGEDAFAFALTEDEFLDILFEDLELPDLVKT